MSLIEILKNEIDPWRADALCKEYPTKMFYAADKVPRFYYDPARLICSKCNVRGECLTYAMVNNEEFGFWGGFSKEERMLIRSVDCDDENSRDACWLPTIIDEWLLAKKNKNMGKKPILDMIGEESCGQQTFKI